MRGSIGTSPRKSDAELLGDAPAAALPEDVVLAIRQIRRREVRHVLDDAEDRDARPSRTSMSPLRASISETSFGGGHDHGARERRLLGQRERGVAGAGRQVDHEVVELAPVDVGEELLDEAVHHRARAR